MTERKDIEKQESRAVKQARQDERAIRPAVDICEDATGILLQADMPGVTKDGLDIQVDNDSLSIQGKACVDAPENMEVLYADVSVTRYQRGFSLSSELDASKIDASLKDGVLTLHIPKRENHKPRKIEVQMG